MNEIHKLLKHITEQHASDLHISAGSPVMIRLNGAIKKLDEKPLGKETAQKLLYQILNQEQISFLEQEHELDFSVEIPEIGRFRVNIFHQRQGLGAVFRVIPSKIRSLEELGLPKVIKELIDLDYGLILVTGPTGSGKTTTLAAMIDYINSTKSGHIITIEDPIEFVHTPKKCNVNQREVGTNTHSFARALRSALREDPDYILVGEMRDLETISLALTAAETGHLVFGTLHTSSAPKTITRIIDVFPSGDQDRIRIQLSESIQGVIAQRLYPVKDNTGRVAAFEILIATQAVRNLIREQKIFQIESVIQTGRQLGMQNLEQAKRHLVAQGKLDPKFLKERMTLY
ncbi:MAG TPA: type IV pilus twitching motility protein PilT [candidate division WOR-3 bacterium]|uniref:Type IV pilus twitching motility protein PilT n=1 Tax=candidate division WOR-3 bacterium TaxID=2052148 RepID=A0A9C9ELU7_UNCW3|nr:type IV pilus twitching motility protein PilT [candidate division WOR-3 bacterium]